MIKNLADQLTDILNWVDDPGLGEHAREEANAGLVIFCRGLVCGLRSVEQTKGDTPITIDEARCREKLRSCSEGNAQLRPANECDRSMMGKIPSKEDF